MTDQRTFCMACRMGAVLVAVFLGCQTSLAKLMPEELPQGLQCGRAYAVGAEEIQDLLSCFFDTAAAGEENWFSDRRLSRVKSQRSRSTDVENSMRGFAVEGLQTDIDRHCYTAANTLRRKSVSGEGAAQDQPSEPLLVMYSYKLSQAEMIFYKDIPCTVDDDGGAETGSSSEVSQCTHIAAFRCPLKLSKITKYKSLFIYRQ